MKKFNKPEDFLFESFKKNEQIKYKNKVYFVKSVEIKGNTHKIRLANKNSEFVTIDFVTK